jgi:hypothetical protein
MQSDEQIGSAFNEWFTQIESNASIEMNDCLEHVDSAFHNAIRANRIKRPKKLFKFALLKQAEVEAKLSGLKPYSPDYIAIPFKVIKRYSVVLAVPMKAVQ